jgi:hypothetical protein
MPATLTCPKRCSKCGSAGPFYKNRAMRDGLTNQCRRCHNASATRWAKANPEKTRAIGRRFERAHRDERSKCRTTPQVLKAWRNANHIKLVAQAREWWKTHPEQLAAKKARRRARVHGVEVRLTAKEWRDIVEFFGHRCAYCLRGDVKLTQDHVVALSRGGTHTAENVVPACLPCNSKHKRELPVFWMVNIHGRS